jgi:hypothetical protein
MTSRIIGKLLTDSQKTQTIIGVRKKNDETDVWIGYIKNFNENIFVMQLISPLGLEDLLIIEKIENVDNFETNDDYIVAIQRLYELNRNLPRQEIKNINISVEEDWLYEMLKSGFHQGRLITIELNNSENINYGYILDFDDTSVQIMAISNIGKEDGTQTYNLNDITSVGIDRIEGRKRELLSNLK